ncbi:ATP-binding protein [Poseidonibacter antarcticus]|uniref:ATP-binding protein n=1 Tax=Poseidonibacter antarcticus TaxID=2478538 RepID=UPI000EF49B37|nr:helicase HerA-like domain-containing protein [Poseidonibacter antarcticus]
MSSTIDYEKLKLFYIGKEKIDEDISIPLVYKNKDLRTHAAIIGMTGSGKTGLGISLLEEAAIDNIPSIIIDPKGDMGNLLLTFPNLKGEDFKPWIEEQDAINNGLSLDEQAQKTADMWEKGITGDFQSKERIAKLKNSADFSIYTPGSTAGIPISILSSFKAPGEKILEDYDLLSSLINSTVSSILSLVDIKSDSSSKENILLCSIFMNSYTQDKNLSLEQLITLIVTPPFEKVGIFDLETFFSQDERLKLALKLNTIIANPSFKNWIEGEPLDISNLLYDENGKAKVSIFSISHLDDAQRMFFVSLLLNEMLTWMRRQEGTSSLKALLYMDEIFGYFPPSKNPPSKQPMLTLLKQARSFGVGIILSTQNPVDIDYKGLSNIGTWFIGRLQTKQDKEKVIDGLSSANEGNIDKKELLNTISNLEKRTFIMKNINEDGIKIFQTRWVLSYLKGPISKDDIKKLMSEKIAKLKEKITPSNLTKKHIEKKETTSNSKSSNDYIKPIIPNIIEQKYSYYSQSDEYSLQPYLLCSSSINFVNTTKNIDKKEDIIYKIYLDKNIDEINFEEKEDVQNSIFEHKSRTNSSFYELPSFLQNEREIKSLQKEFSNYIYRNEKLNLFKNTSLKLTSKQDESLNDFRTRLQDKLNEKIDDEVEKLEERFEKTQKSLEKKLDKLYIKLEKEKEQASAKTTNTLISIGTSILGAFFGNSILSKTNMTKVASSARGASSVLKERSDIKYVEADIQNLAKEIEELEEQLIEEIEEINKNYSISNYKIEEFSINLRRKDIYNTKIQILWEEI